MSKEKMNIKDMIHICFMVTGIEKNRVQVIAHEVRPGTYAWSELSFNVPGAPQIAVLPTPVGDLMGKVYEYTGPTTDKYTHGMFYECANTVPRFEYIDFYNIYEPHPRPRHRVRKLMGHWQSLY